MIPPLFRGTIPPAPFGWTEAEWRRSLLGDTARRRGRLLNAGKGWLLAVIIVLVILTVILVAVLVH